MLGKFIKTTKKSIVLTVSGAFAVTAVANAYQAEEQTYIIQGASPATISQLVEHVGGEVIQNIKLVNGVSASLTEQEVSTLKGQNSLLRFDSKSNSDEVAGFVWDTIGTKGSGKKTKKNNYSDSQVAGFVWDTIGKKGSVDKTKKNNFSDSQIAGFVWDYIGKKGSGKKTKKNSYSDSQIAGFVWDYIGKKGTKLA